LQFEDSTVLFRPALLIVAALLATVSWSSTQEDASQRQLCDDAIIANAENQVANSLRDPGAIFRDVQVFRGSKAVCGTVITSSPRGGGGESFFVAFRSGYVRATHDMPPGNFLSLVQENCRADGMVERARRLVFGPAS
jgi:hypothetical protein